jgi:hypothetical protein
MYVKTYYQTEYTITCEELKQLIVDTQDESIVEELKELWDDYNCADDEFCDDTLFIDGENISGELETFFNEIADVREWE